MADNLQLIGQKIYMSKVTFERKQDLPGNFQVVVDDRISDVLINEEGISLRYIRHVSLKPEALFDISVEFMYSSKFEQKSLEIIKNKKFELDTATLQKIVVNSTMPQNASLIISTLTHINGGNPLITPPNFCK